jgi:hypothetical protein
MYPQLVTVFLLGSALAPSALGENPASAKDLDLRVVDSDLQPEVTVKRYENRRVDEYRVNDNIYMVKITPKSGNPYYLVDDDGSGEMEMRTNAGGRDIRVPQWSLSSW